MAGPSRPIAAGAVNLKRPLARGKEKTTGPKENKARHKETKTGRKEMKVSRKKSKLSNPILSMGYTGKSVARLLRRTTAPNMNN
ncbi:MAG: hypothetical protein WB647_16035 [Roseiarcus sp.]|uniref:hypothetical protein n=1 Tax=Roseiarcus sp. TaxID=1969460 RepID=UPI003C6B9AF2